MSQSNGWQSVFGWKRQSNGQAIICDICKQNNYNEVIGTIDKSKARTVIRDFFLGSESGNIDNTSIIQYFCNICGYCKIIRNKDPLVITATKLQQ